MFITIIIIIDEELKNVYPDTVDRTKLNNVPKISIITLLSIFFKFFSTIFIDLIHIPMKGIIYNINP